MSEKTISRESTSSTELNNEANKHHPNDEPELKANPKIKLIDTGH